ncbi:MAG: GNAT family N-acetyltransferase [Bacillota bacterium]|nr:GNAT family N-acetyltransferase [Bacillota bacterium]
MTTLEDISREVLTESWNRCWHGYYYNMTYSQDHLIAWLYLSQVSLQYSCAIYVEDIVVGFSLLSLDGKDGWIAGACIDPNYRRLGLFAPLMRAQLNMATRLGLSRIFLEVLKTNTNALRVYQSVGFKITRELNLFRVEKKNNDLNRAVETSYIGPISLERYFETRDTFFHPSWQRREGYLRRYRHCLGIINSSRTAGALFAGENYVTLLDIWSTTEAGAEEVISYALSKLTPSFSLTNQPGDWIAVKLSALGITPCAKQFEMCVSLT